MSPRKENIKNIPIGPGCIGPHLSVILVLGKQRLGGLWFEASLSKKLMKLHLNNKSDVVADICYPSYLGGYT
jgi:hypothetical protein